MKHILSLLLILSLSLSVLAQRNAATTFEDAKRAIEAGRYDEGVGYFRKQLRGDPRDWVSAYYVVWADANLDNYQELLEASEVVLRYGTRDAKPYMHRCRAMARISMGDGYSSAIGELDKGLKIDNKDYFSLGLRANIYMQMAMNEMRADDAYDSLSTFARIEGSRAGEKLLVKSDDDYRRMTKADPDLSAGYGGLAQNSYLRRQWDQAATYARQALEATTQNDAAPYWVLLKVYLMRGQYSEACDVYIRGLNAPTRMNDYFWTLEDTLADHSFSQLLTKLQIQSNKDADNALWPYTIGRLYGKRYNTTKQVDYYRRAYRRMPQSAWYATRLASALAEQGNWQACLAYARRAVSLKPESAAAHYTLSTALYYSGLPEAAIEEITKAIELSPEHSFYYNRRGFYNMVMRHYDDAIDDYSAAIELDHDYAYAYYHRGKSYDLKGQYSLAVKDYQRTAEIDTAIDENMCAQYALLALGDTARAIDMVTRQLDRFPYDAGVLYDAACIYSRMNRYDQAFDYLERSLRAGFTHRVHMLLDDDLEFLRTLPRFERLMEQYPAPTFDNEDLSELEGTDSDDRSTSTTTPRQGNSDPGNTLRSLAPRN